MSSYLIHYGIKGQRWNDRRYQYEDGSLTPEGKIRYGVGQGRRHPSRNYRPGNKSYSKGKTTNNTKVNKSYKPKKSSYNMNKDMKKSVKSIKNDKKFIDKANEFLSTPLGRIIVGTAISGIIGVGFSVLKEGLLVDLKLKNKPRQFMSEDEYNNKQKDVESKRYRVKVDGKKVVDTMDTVDDAYQKYGSLAGMVSKFKVAEPTEYDASEEAVKKKKKE